MPAPAVTFQKFERGSKPKHLGTDAPSSTASKDINAWTKRVLTPIQHKKIAAVIAEIKETLKDKEDHTELVLRAVVEWGMPITLAGNVGNEGAIKILAVVSML